MDELLKKLPPPNHSQLKSFIGMITFFHKFGKDLATVLHPLYSLQKSKDWYWKTPEQQAYVRKGFKSDFSTGLSPVFTGPSLTPHS
jgi:hypothetical protein